MTCLEKGPRKFQFLFNEIEFLSSAVCGIQDVDHFANGMADALTKLGVVRYGASFALL